MRIYTVHELPEAPLDGAGIVLVREGFSFPAFAFSWMWLLWHRLWIPFGLWIGAVALTSFLMQMFFGPVAAGLVSLALQVLLGFEAHDIRRWGMERRGYRMVGVAGGKSVDEAERSFFAKWDKPIHLDRVSASNAPVWPHNRMPAQKIQKQAEPEVLGLFPDARGWRS